VIFPALAEPRTTAPDWSWLDAGLAIAQRSDGFTFIALPAPVLPAAAIADEFRDQPLAAWTSAELTVVGVGVARELRGAGRARWAQVIAGAHAIATATPDPGDEPRDTMPTLGKEAHRAVIAGVVAPTAWLGFARPRFLGGAAFAPGAADHAPWRGFGDAWFALPRWTYVHDGTRAFLVLAVDATDAQRAATWRDELAIFRAALAGGPIARSGSLAVIDKRQPSLVELAPAPAAEWTRQVTEITDAIARGEHAKVVAARTCLVRLAGPVRTAGLLAALDERHGDCVRVMIKPPGAAALVAASPERLVRRDGDIVLCDALAGSVANSGDVARATAALRASTKDRREHDLVVHAIRGALEDAGAKVEAPTEPAVRTLRHVLHLHTPFRAELRTPRHVLELAARLHPTPAVGGTPQAVATEWIRTHEPAPRGWYASPVGWFDLEGNGELAVALRSGVIDGNRAHLWAGAGIVAGSDPGRELAETEVKLRAMLNALGVAA
jgi:isochorismate synthase